MRSFLFFLLGAVCAVGMLSLILESFNFKGSGKATVSQTQVASRGEGTKFSVPSPDQLASLLKRTGKKGELADHLAEAERISILHFLCQQAENGEMPFQEVLAYYHTLSTYDQERYRELVFSSWTRADPIESFHAIAAQRESIGDDEVAYFQRKALEAVVELDPQGGVALLESIVSDELRYGYMIRIAGGMANTAFDQAFEFLTTLDERGAPPRIVNQAYVEIMQKYIGKDPWAAAEAIGQLEAAEIQGRLIVPLMERLVEQDYEASLEWLSELKDQRIRDEALKAFSEVYTETDSHLLMSKILSDDTKFGPQAVSHAIWTLAEGSPELLAENFDSISGDLQAEAGGRLISEWIRSDVEGAKEWLASAENEKVSDAGVSEMAKHFLYRDPVVSMEWAAQIKNDQMRNEFFDNMVHAVDRNHIESFIEKVQGSEIPEQERSYIHQKLQDRLADINAPLILPQ